MLIPDPNGDFMRMELPDITGPMNLDALFGGSDKPLFTNKEFVWAVKSKILDEWMVVGTEPKQ